jgi:hypothetical protein
MLRWLRCCLFHRPRWRIVLRRDDPDNARFVTTYECPRCGDRWVTYGSY